MEQPLTSATLKQYLEYQDGHFIWLEKRGPRAAYSSAGHKRKSGIVIVRLFGRSYSTQQLYRVYHDLPPQRFVSAKERERLKTMYRQYASRYPHESVSSTPDTSQTCA